MKIFSKLFSKKTEIQVNDDRVKQSIQRKLAKYNPEQKKSSFNGPALHHLNINPDDTINWNISGIHKIPTLRETV